MSDGERIHLINIQEKTQTQNTTTGEITESWANLHTNIFASIKDQSVRGFLQSQADQTEVSTRIEIDYITGLDSTMRIVGVCSCHLNVVYNPVGILADDKTGQEYLTIPCKKGVNEG